MNAIYYWECKKNEREAGVLNEEAVSLPVAAKLIAAKSSRGEKAGSSGWKGPGTLWIAKAEDSLRKS